MVEENSPKRRQVRKAERKLARRKASRKGMPAILVVCEGQETEPNYIRGLCEHLSINLAAVRIEAGDRTTDPAGLVRRAQKLFRDDGGYDRVFVVCDGDLPGLTVAKQVAQGRLRNKAGETTTVQVIATHPCFEFWLLLHFEYSAAPRSAAEAGRDLRAYLTAYGKAEPRIFEMVAGGLDRACAHAARLKQELARFDATTPDTDMGEFVAQLIGMKRAAEGQRFGKLWDALKTRKNTHLC